MQRYRIPPGATLNNCVSVSPAVQPGTDTVPKIEFVSITVRLNVNNAIGRVARFVYQPLCGLAFNVLWEASYILRSDTDTGVKGGNLKGGIIIDRYPEINFRDSG